MIEPEHCRPTTMSATLFISDLHLDSARAPIIKLFVRFLDGPARNCDALYILGDLFEVWIGDDSGQIDHQEIITALRNCTDSGVPIFIMHGNRDFLLGEGFAERTACTLLPDPTVLSLRGKPTLLMHGDTLCTDDHDYQTFRSRVRDPEWQSDFLAKSIAERRRIASQLRETSRAAIADKPPEIMDVNQAAVEEAFRQHKVTRLIHGHTHRPAKHFLSIDKQKVQRIVLGDWYEQGSVLRVEDGKLELQNLAVSS